MAKKLTKSKAKKILHDKEVHGHPLTEQQRKFFGAIAGGAKPYKAQAGVKTCPPGFVNIEGKCFDKASDEYKALYKYGIGYMDDEDTLVSSRMELPEVVLKPKSVLDFLDKIDLGTDANYGGGASRYAFDQLGKKYGFIPNVKILKEQQPSELEKLLFDIFDSSDKKRTLEKTAHYIPFIKTAYVDNIKEYIAELSHHVDPLVDNPGMFLITDIPAIINQQDRYKTKGTSEYRAHEEIEPKLKKDFEKYRGEYWDNVFRPMYFDTKNPLLRQERMDDVWNNYVSPVKKKKDGGWLDKYDNAPKAQNGIEGTMGGLTDVGFNYNGAWGGTMQMGGVLPGAVGFTYARTQSPAPANGPYAKKTKASAQNGQEMKYYQEGLDFKPKTISQNGSRTPIVVTDPNDPRLKAYQDSLSLYNRSIADKNRYLKFINSLGMDQSKIAPITRYYDVDYKGNNRPLTKSKIDFVGMDDKGNTLYYAKNKPDGGGINEGMWVDYDTAKKIDKGYLTYKKPVQPVILEEQPRLEKPIPIPRNTRDLGYTLPTPGQFTAPKLYKYDPDTPTKFSFTYPTGGYNEQKTIYFPTRSAWKSYVEGIKGTEKFKSSQEGVDYAQATGYLQDGGDIPVDPMGYWNPENVGNPVTIPSNIITMEGVDQPLIGISDTGDIQYMEPGEDYEFDGEYVTEYPVAQKGKKITKPEDIRETLYVSDPKDPRLRAYQDSLALYNRSNQARVDALLRQGFKYDTENNKKQNYLYTEKEKRDYQKSIGVNPNKGLQKIIQSGNDGRIDQSVGGQYDKKVQYELMHGKIAPIGIAPLYDSWWRTSPTLTLENDRPNPNYGKPFAKDFEGKVIRNFFSVPLYKEPVQPVEYRKPEDRRDTLYVPDINDPRLKAYQDSLDLYKRFPLPPIGYKISPYVFQKTAGFVVGQDSRGNDIIEKRPNTRPKIEPIGYTRHNAGKRGTTYNLNEGKYEDYFDSERPVYKKPVQPVVYRPEPKVEAELPRTVTGDMSYDLPTPKKPGSSKLAKYTSDTPTQYSFTYPTGKYLEDETIYFPTKEAWKSFVEKIKGTERFKGSEERQGYAKATGYLQDGGDVSVAQKGKKIIKPEDRRDTLYVSDLKHPRLKKYQDSASLYKQTQRYLDVIDYNNQVSKKKGYTKRMPEAYPVSFENLPARGENNWLTYLEMPPYKISNDPTTGYKSIESSSSVTKADYIKKGKDKEEIQPTNWLIRGPKDVHAYPYFQKPVEPVVYRPEPEVEYKPRPRVEAELPRTSIGDLSYNLPKAPAQPSKTKKITTQKDEPERTKKTPVKDFLEDIRLRMEDRKMERKTKRGIKSQLKCFSGVCYDNEGNIVQAKDGVSVNNADAQPLKKLDQLLNFTNYNKPTKGGWLDKYN